MTTTLNIPLMNGKVWTVKAEVVGDLALHPSFKNDKVLTVTHVPTLLSFFKALPPDMNKLGPRAQRTFLLAWMNLVQAQHPKDWAALRKLKPQQVRDVPAKSQALRDRVRKFCTATTEVM